VATALEDGASSEAVVALAAKPGAPPAAEAFLRALVKQRTATVAP